MSDSTGKTSSTDTSKSTTSSTDTSAKAKDGTTATDDSAKTAGNGPELVAAEPGTSQYDKTGDAPAVDTHGSPVGYAPYSPESADEYNLAHPVNDEDPNFVEAARKLAPERVPESRRAADIEPKQE